MPSAYESARSRLTLLLIFVVATVFLSQLGSYGLLEPDEGRYAEIAREMAAPDASWLVPRLNGIAHFQKPPLVYWLTTICVKWFGAHEFAVRLPSALAAIATLLMSMGITRRLFPKADEMAARCTLIVLASSPLFLFLGRTLTPDMLMTAWITGAIYCLVRCRGKNDYGARHRHHRWGWAFFVCIGFGFLTKGPVAFLVPIAAAIAYRFTLRRAQAAFVHREQLHLPWFCGILLSMAIGLSWFVAVAIDQPDLLGYFLKYELLDRFTSGNHGRSRPMWFFIPVLLAGFLPWTFFALSSLPVAWRARGGAEFGLFVGWIVVPFVVLSLSGSKLPTYVLPLFPGLAVALGAHMAPRAVAFSLPQKLLAAATLLIIAAVPVVAPTLLDEPTPTLPVFALVVAGIAVVAAAAWLILSRKRTSALVTLSLGGIALLLWSSYPSQVSSWNNLLEQQACVRSLAVRISQEKAQLSSEAVRVIACEIRAHGLAFYLDDIVEITRSEADIVLLPTNLDRRLPVIHERPKSVATLPCGKSERGLDTVLFVVTRLHRFERDFAARGWTIMHRAGDFVLLRR